MLTIYTRARILQPHSSFPCRQFTLVRVVNVVKRVDGVQGSRYLLELELRDAHGQLLRLSHYIYALNRHSRHRGKDFGFRPMKPQLVLCNPVGFRWYPAATVHFIVPGSPTFDPCSVLALPPVFYQFMFQIDCSAVSWG